MSETSRGVHNKYNFSSDNNKSRLGNTSLENSLSAWERRRNFRRGLGQHKDLLNSVLLEATCENEHENVEELENENYGQANCKLSDKDLVNGDTSTGQARSGSKATAQTTWNTSFAAGSENIGQEYTNNNSTGAFSSLRSRRKVKSLQSLVLNTNITQSQRIFERPERKSEPFQQAQDSSTLHHSPSLGNIATITNIPRPTFMRQKTLTELNDDLGNIFQTPKGGTGNGSPPGSKPSSLTKAEHQSIRNPVHSSSAAIFNKNYETVNSASFSQNLDLPYGQQRMRSASFGDFGELTRELIEKKFGRLFCPADQTIPGSPDESNSHLADNIDISPPKNVAAIPLISCTPPSDELLAFQQRLGRSRSSSLSEKMFSNNTSERDIRTSLDVPMQRVHKSVSTSRIDVQHQELNGLSRPSSRKSLLDEMTRPLSRLSVDDHQDIYPTPSIAQDSLQDVSRQVAEIIEPVSKLLSEITDPTTEPLSRLGSDVPLTRPISRAESEMIQSLSRPAQDLLEIKSRASKSRPLSRAASEMAESLALLRPSHDMMGMTSRPVSRAASEISEALPRLPSKAMSESLSRPVSRCASEMSEAVSRPVSRMSLPASAAGVHQSQQHNNQQQQKQSHQRQTQNHQHQKPHHQNQHKHQQHNLKPQKHQQTPTGTESKSPRAQSRRPRVGGGLLRSLSRTSIYEEPIMLDDVDVYHTINGEASLTNTRPALPFAKIQRRTARQVAHGLPADVFSEAGVRNGLASKNEGENNGQNVVADCETESVFSFCEENSWRVRLTSTYHVCRQGLFSQYT